MRGASVSYIFPIYNETGNIPLLYQRVCEATADLPYDIELLFVNDGSADASLALLLDLQEHDDRVTVIDFARNYGHQLAVTAGLDAATGDAVIVMDSDLQDPPAVSRELLERWEDGYDVVYAQRRTRQDTAFKKATAAIFYKVLQKVSEIDIPPNTGDFRLLDRRVVEEIKKFREHDRFIRGMVSYIGFKQTAVQFDRDERFAGVTGYPLRKMLKLAADGILGFSTFPLTVISRMGFAAAGLSLLGVIYALYMKLFVPEAVIEGWTFIVIAVLFMGGLQLIMLGILGGYVGRIYKQVQNRPLYGVRNVYASHKVSRGTKN
ncbi:glycosyltransferase family 2 protein [Arthrobacter sp. 2YAF22_2]|uniref:glycosyltransferase family 2 protein n=1 Tax=Arthrobacter sp. 2YAF22_2 TaxID=3233029 RepID=UPI003F92C3E8